MVLDSGNSSASWVECRGRQQQHAHYFKWKIPACVNAYNTLPSILKNMFDEPWEDEQE